MIGRLLKVSLLGAFLFLFSGPPQAGCQEGRDEALSLAQAVALALDTHPMVGQASAARDAAGAIVKQARAAWLPSLAGQGSLTRHQEPMIVAPLHGFDPMSPPSFDKNLVQGAVSLGYTLFDGGARSARIQRAEAGERAASAGGMGAQMAVTSQVSAVYLAVLYSEELLTAVQGQKDALLAELERVSLFLEQGKAAQVDLLRVEAALSRVEAQEVSARSDVALYRSRLARLTGLEVEAVRERALNSVAPKGRGDPAAEFVLASALEANPELARAREELSGARAGVREARAAWLPKVEANGRYADFGTLDGSHVQEWQGALQISYPIFTGGAREGERERAGAQERQVAETVRLVELEVKDQVETATAAVRETRAVREALEVSVAQTEEVARIEALALEAGAGVQTDFLRAQAELFQVQASLSRARHGEVMARIELARVQGQLSLAWIQENMEMVR
jgi:outer membrane protein TolC